MNDKLMDLLDVEARWDTRLSQVEAKDAWTHTCMYHQYTYIIIYACIMYIYIHVSSTYTYVYIYIYIYLL